MTDFIVCAAIRHNENKQIICGVRHFDRIMHQQIERDYNPEWKFAEQGFVNVNGEFLTREDAYKIAHENGQALRPHPSEKLFSEDLY